MSYMNFKLMLVLMYFEEYKSEYLLSEICNLCSFTTKQLDESIKVLIEDGFLEERNNMIMISIKGTQFLVEQGYNKISLNDLNDSILTLEINDYKLGFEDLYIPNGFKP